MIGLLWMVGCGTSAIEMAAVVGQGPEDPRPAVGVNVEVLTGDGEVWAEAVTDDDGVFRVDAPYQAMVFLVVSGDGLTPASFTGETGTVSPFLVPDGVLWALPQAETARWRADFAGCPGADDPAAGMVFGTVLMPFSDGDGLPVEASDAFVFGTLKDGTRVDACYLDVEAGVAYDPEATLVGESGRFVMFGPTGVVWEVAVARNLGSATLRYDTRVFVPDEGAAGLWPYYAPL